MLQQWFKDAKLGIFLHWGLYSVNGIPESWSFYNGDISYENYMKQAARFTAARYDAEKWARLFQQTGAKYAVLTAKHHDGFALWDTAESDLSVCKQTPAARDLIAPYCAAMRRSGLKVGLYFSHLDWSHPDNNAVVHPDPTVYNLPYNPFTHHSGIDDYERWARFLQFRRAQLTELMTRYGTIDLLWFDGDWEKDASQWDMQGLRTYLHTLNPKIVLNDRMQGFGDYATPEHGFPTADPSAEAWEYGITINDSWGYQKEDRNFKSVTRLERIFAEIIGRGGNMLLAVGPKEDGTFQPEQEQILIEFGDWLRPISEAVYGTRQGLDYRHYLGPSTISSDRRNIYLFVFDNPTELFIKGIKNKVKSATLLGSGQQLEMETMKGAEWNGVPPTLWIRMPQQLKNTAAVVRLALDGEIDLFCGAGGSIACN